MLLLIIQVLVYIEIHINSLDSVNNLLSYPSNQTSKMIERLFQGKNKSKNSQSKHSSFHSILPGSLESSKQYIKTRLARHIFSSSADNNIQDDQPDPGPLGANGVRDRFLIGLNSKKKLFFFSKSEFVTISFSHSITSSTFINASLVYRVSRVSQERVHAETES